ncbi:uncharacterized protein B0I36DRAFT_331169 [Microdochium trichocladiopsis]|uniref:Secreted protein n=1 Tax=Microdochium trichocladiopsis TaxID=1682393 RepID=A0A9P8Y0V4_9PEZI|nr:uncharacterized protein B0I36DRAFT_331169 [Microdochium trichocladiopsis]KAH7026702.1 hypothetical protein B0I36DRAFT_331169 [Microdochium trichocladiopsis]
MVVVFLTQLATVVSGETSTYRVTQSSQSRHRSSYQFCPVYLLGDLVHKDCYVARTWYWCSTCKARKAERHLMLPDDLTLGRTAYTRTHT